MKTYLDEILELNAHTLLEYEDQEYSDELSTSALAKATAYNRQSAQRVGWAAYRNNIATRLLNLGSSPGEEAFAAGVATWQSTRGLPADGQLGPRTWSMMQTALGGSPGAPGSIVVKKEPIPPVQTLYARIDLRVPKAKQLTGIYIPPAYRANEPPEIIVYLHGHNRRIIDDYWKQSYFLLREALAQSGRNCILVAPTLGPKSEYGTLAQTGGFDRFMNQVVAILKNTQFMAPGTNVGRIILACHSGGGSAMRRIANLSDAYAQLIRECWGFDCLYANKYDVDSTVWAKWAKARPHAKIYVYYYRTTACQSVKLACATRGAANIFIQAARIPDHNLLVLPSWRERLSNVPTGPFNFARCANVTKICQ